MERRYNNLDSAKLQNQKDKIQSSIFKINIFFDFQAADH